MQEKEYSKKTEQIKGTADDQTRQEGIRNATGNGKTGEWQVVKEEQRSEQKAKISE